LSDELIGIGIDARVHQLDEFSAASDRWSSKYLVRVPAEAAGEAADHVRQYLFDDDDGRKSALDAFRFALVGRPGQPSSWRPAVLVVLAGVASFALVERFSVPNAQRRPRQDSLASAMDAIGQSFTTEPAANQPRYRLSFDRRQHFWTLETDRDNDGVFETSQRFSASATDQ
jgi:hypothetical protein